MSDQPCKVLLICRSSTWLDLRMSVDENALHDQEVLLRDWLNRNVSGEPDVRVTNSADEHRHDMLDQSQDELGKGCDLVLVQRLDRIARGFGLFRFLELARRQNTRIVSIADSFDSSAPNSSVAMMMIGCRFGFDFVVTQRRIRRHRRRR
jgi:DNA invertase Pin-like site-specific DNA recombinase